MSEQVYENIKQENSALRNENAMLKEELSLANQQLEWFRKQVFGRKTEQTSVVMDFGVQLSMFEKDKAETVSAAQAVTVPEHKRRKKLKTGNTAMTRRVLYLCKSAEPVALDRFVSPPERFIDVLLLYSRNLFTLYS